MTQADAHNVANLAHCWFGRSSWHCPTLAEWCFFYLPRHNIVPTFVW